MQLYSLLLLFRLAELVIIAVVGQFYKWDSRWWIYKYHDQVLWVKVIVLLLDWRGKHSTESNKEFGLYEGDDKVLSLLCCRSRSIIAHLFFVPNDDVRR